MRISVSESELSQHPIVQTLASERIGLYNRPIYLLLTITCTVIISEILVMMILSYLPHLTPVQNSLFDAALLSITIFPAMYLCVFKPMNKFIEQQRQSKVEKDILIAKLNKALDEVNTLQGIIPICAWCKKIRDDDGYWQQVEVYLVKNPGISLTHGCCPDCADKAIQALDVAND